MLRFRIKQGIYRVFDVSVVIVVLFVMGCIYIVTYGEAVLRNNPEVITKVSSTVIKDAAGAEITRFRTQSKGFTEYADLEDMPDLLVQAFLATEDRRFYDHDGLDYIGIGRAVAQDVIHMDWSQGGSSITQQLARNLYLNGEKTLVRKVNEMSIALSLEKRFNKDELLEMYLNHIYMGRQQYGVKAAAWRYFGNEDLHQLELWQIATLAGIPKGPSIYNPVDDYERSKQRRSVILTLMHEQGLVTKGQMLEARQVDYTPPAAGMSAAGEYNKPDYISAVDAVIQEAARLTGKRETEIQSAGWTIHTGLDSQAQLAMEETFRETSRFTDDREDQQVQASMVIVDQHNGEVKAMMGGRDPVTGGINRAIKDARQPGSAFKPIIAYGPALESGRFSPESMLPDKRISYGSYQPSNLGGQYRGSVSMSLALQKSINAPAVWLLKQTGLEAAHVFAGRLGIELGQEDLNLSIALGGVHKGISPLKMAQAYSVFANDGKYNTAHLIREITDADGQIIYAHKPENKQVIASSTANAMTKMLRNVVSQGTGSRAQLSHDQVAGKTGTTQAAVPGVGRDGNRDLWFVGYTSKWTAAVWMGFDHTDAEHYMRSGSGNAADMFATVMRRAAQ
ncbi:transglycosylase domain-containing protein [Paenibacillus xylanilyticus]|uniref:PBP1A family penicillin-binding protein n=1 Tax=Paenibacillus xylanilyticus TaxID=248903 RepID=A0A7Y6C1D0_9BACL|nr:PBP1A family penicillin-binding protein [Paenibacillus xylanilyticus]NUU78750.1 PBP1A family penicillin-binding protein [Paenibacillus xylanilyticus]